MHWTTQAAIAYGAILVVYFATITLIAHHRFVEWDEAAEMFPEWFKRTLMAPIWIPLALAVFAGFSVWELVWQPFWTLILHRRRLAMIAKAQGCRKDAVKEWGHRRGVTSSNWLAAVQEFRSGWRDIRKAAAELIWDEATEGGE